MAMVMSTLRSTLPVVPIVQIIKSVAVDIDEVTVYIYSESSSILSRRHNDAINVVRAYYNNHSLRYGLRNLCRQGCAELKYYNN